MCVDVFFSCMYAYAIRVWIYACSCRCMYICMRMYVSLHVCICMFVCAYGHALCAYVKCVNICIAVTCMHIFACICVYFV